MPVVKTIDLVLDKPKKKDVYQNYCKYIRDSLLCSLKNSAMFLGWDNVEFNKTTGEIEFEIDDDEISTYHTYSVVAEFEESEAKDFTVNIFEDETHISVFLIFKDTEQKNKNYSFPTEQVIKDKATLKDFTKNVVGEYVNWIHKNLFTVSKPTEVTPLNSIIQIPQLPRADFIRELKDIKLVGECSVLSLDTLCNVTGNVITVQAFIESSVAKDFMLKANSSKGVSFDSDTHSFSLFSKAMLN